MPYAKELKQTLVRMLGEVIEEPLAAHGFKRPRKSIVYARKVPDGRQTIEIHAWYNPPYGRPAEAHIYPFLRVYFPAVGDKLLELTGGDRKLASFPELMLNQPVLFCGPRELNGGWYVSGWDQFLGAGREVVRYLLEWVIPFLSEIQTPEQLLRAFLRADERRISRAMESAIRMAAIYCLLGDTASAKALVEEKLGQPGNRRFYAKVFEYFEKL